MYSPLSDNYQRRVRESGLRRTVADVYQSDVLVASDLPVSSGSIRVELDGQVRRSGNITIADPGLVPTLSDLLSPLGAEIRIRQGVVFPDGSEELIPLGVFRMDVTDWGEVGGVPQVQFYDRSKAIASAKLPSYVSRSGRMASAVIREVLEWHYPSFAPIENKLVIDDTLVDYRLPGGHRFEQDNYWDAITDLAKNMGGRLFFDVEGVPRIDPVRELASTTTPDLTIDAGANGVLVDATHSYSREGVYNGITVVGAAKRTGGPVRATVYNLDQSSPLRYGGLFGRVVDVIEDSSLTTAAQCYKRARIELGKYTGLGYSLDFSAVPNPAIDAGDFLKFVFPSGRTELHQVASLTVPLGPGAFTGESKGLYLNE